MKLNKTEKEYLQQLLKRELDSFEKDKEIFLGEGGIAFFQAEEEYQEFLEELLNKLK